MPHRRVGVIARTLGETEVAGTITPQASQAGGGAASVSATQLRVAELVGATFRSRLGELRALRNLLSQGQAGFDAFPSGTPDGWIQTRATTMRVSTWRAEGAYSHELAGTDATNPDSYITFSGSAGSCSGWFRVTPMRWATRVSCR
jgi:hypothetical protein